MLSGLKHRFNITKEFITTKNWKAFDWQSQSLDLNPIAHAFHLHEETIKQTTKKNNLTCNLEKKHNN